MVPIEMVEEEETLTDLPPSAKLVYKTLEYEEELTQKQIVTETHLSPRTTRYAVRRLQKGGFIEQDIHFPDARQKIYRIKD